jgi:hypothetical protein
VNPAWWDAAAEVVVAASVFTAAVVWIVKAINAAIARAAFKAAKQAAAETFTAAATRSEKGLEDVRTVVTKFDRWNTITVALCLGAVTTYWLDRLTRK